MLPLGLTVKSNNSSPYIVENSSRLTVSGLSVPRDLWTLSAVDVSIGLLAAMISSLQLAQGLRRAPRLGVGRVGSDGARGLGLTTATSLVVSGSFTLLWDTFTSMLEVTVPPGFPSGVLCSQACHSNCASSQVGGLMGGSNSSANKSPLSSTCGGVCS